MIYSRLKGGYIFVMVNQVELQRIKNIVSKILEKSWNDNKYLSRLALITVGVQELSRQVKSSKDKSIKDIRVMQLQQISISIVNQLIVKNKIKPMS